MLSLLTAAVILFCLAMGLVALAAPERISAINGTPTLTVAGRNEIRAVYGGFGVVMAGMLCWGLADHAMRAGVLLTSVRRSRGWRPAASRRRHRAAGALLSVVVLLRAGARDGGSTVGCRPRLTRGSGRALAQRLSISNSSIDLDEPEPLVGSLARLVVEQRVRGEFLQPPFPRPRLDGTDERAPHAGTTPIRIDVPAFEKRDRTARASVGVAPDADLGEPAQSSELAPADDHGRIRPREPRCHLDLVSSGRVVRPQRTAHATPFRPVSHLECAHRRHGSDPAVHPGG